jgi:NitT/TauT family transport system substrate-binding protein
MPLLHKHTKRAVMLGACLTGLAGAAVAQQPPTLAKVKVALAKSVSNGAMLIAQERGYFKEAGIDLDLQDIDTTADALTLVAQNQIQIVGGGVSAGYFNAIDRGLPVTITISRVAFPAGHNLMIRPDLAGEIKTLKDLKGRNIASNGPGSISTYEIGKMLEPHGISLADVNIKIFPFPQYAIAFANKAVDAGLVIPPWTVSFEKQNIAIPFGSADKLVPGPVTISVNFVNTDWLAKNHDVANRFYLAYLKGARDWCQGYHGAPIRKEIVALLVKSKVETRPEILDGFWTARPIDGRVNEKSILDVQDFYLKEKMIKKTFPLDKLVDYRFVDWATKQLPPFVVENKASMAEGCR